ncbi:MAG: HD domain-containing phosphohydrolase [Thermoanaerobaculia bacterium]|jgi:HD-GYP domain-containing protein (c-di-GMP phosphodiesterase class II)
MQLEDPTYLALHRYTKALSVALGFRDLYTRIHSDRVLTLSEAMGVRAGLSERELGILRISAAFHDIGKIGIPDQILLKPSRLDDQESVAMRKHSELGASIVLATELEGADEVAKIIRHHHENWDGTGYPDSVAGKAIPTCSRIIGIADSYDAMALARAYHPAKAHEEIMQILRDETGKKHDPELMRIFVEVVEAVEHGNPTP